MKFEIGDWVEIKTVFSHTSEFDGLCGTVKKPDFHRPTKTVSYAQYLVDVEFSPVKKTEFWFFEEELKKVEKSA